MNRRLRFVAALLALSGFTAFYAEGLAAMSCMPAGSSADTASELAGHDGMHESAPLASNAGSEVPPQCPLAMADGSCIVPATLPQAVAAARIPAPATRAVVSTVPDAAHDVIVRPLFHPPRA